MAAGIRRVFPRSLTVRGLVVLWAGSVLLAWVLLVGGWLLAEMRLSAIADRVIMDIRALSEARELESTILAYRREDLLWEATGLSSHRERACAHLERAERVAASVDPYVTTPDERELLVRIQQELASFHAEWMPATVDSTEAEARSVDVLLATVDRFQAQNESQMGGSIRAANRLRRIVTYGALGLSAGTAVLLVAGAWSLVRRVIRPVLAVTDAAGAFGHGRLSARAPILYDDEMGALARTFNNMAGDIADREKDRLQFVAMVVHDLKNPIRAIEMAVHVLQQPGAPEAQRRFFLEGIQQEATRLRTIVRDLTDDIQVANGRFSVQKAEVDLGALVRRFVETHGRSFTTHPMVVNAEEGCSIQGDVHRLERVLMNLVSNAVKYTPPGTRVTVGVEKEDTRAVLTVADQGPGIPPDDVRVLFQPFGRGRAAASLAEGTGMGLYVVQQIVEAHGGRIDVQSTPGQGTTFRIRLPLAHAAIPA